MEVAIWGAGAVGLGLAASLARDDRRVRLIGRDPETADAIARDGILRSGLFGRREAMAAWLLVDDDPAAMSASPPDWLLVCTKAFATPAIASALEPLASRLAPSTRLVLCQNGWGNEAPFLPYWPSERLFHAVIITGFHRRGLREVEITAHAAPLAFGHLANTDVAPLELLVEALQQGGLPSETRADLHAVAWAKMLYNCALNPLGALTDRRYGQLTEDPTTRDLVDGVIGEIFAVLDATGIRVAWPDASAYRAHFHRELIPPTARHESSMLQDLRAGRPTEIEALCGAVCRLGEAAGVETPIVSALATLVRQAESRGGSR